MMNINLDSRIEGFTPRELYTYMWATMSKFLKVTAQQTLTRGITPDKPPLTIQFTVLNEAPNGSNMPELTFNEIRLFYGIPPDWKTENIPDLSTGKSHQFDYICNFNDASKVQYYVEGKIIPSFNMQVKNDPQIMSPSWSILSIPQYFDLVDAIHIHQWLDRAIRNVVIPTTNTTLGEVKEIQKTYHKYFEEIEEVKKILESATPYLPIGGSLRDRFLQLRNQIIAYLDLTFKHCGRISEGLKIPDVRTIEAEKKHAIARLSQEATIIDKAIVDFKNSLKA